MAEPDTQAYTKLKEQLRDMFQLDRGDLDFGLYRIMNQKREEVTKFLDEQLLPQVREELNKYRPAGLDTKVKELKEAEASPGKFAPDYIEGLRAEINSKVDVDKLEKEIYSDLYNFFKRYYSDGDFMSMRRYKEGVYALPYEGEEVKLHWANHDQYYIKTSEDLKNYTFKVKDGKRVRFEVVAGGTETNNNKAAEGKERRFVLFTEEPVKAEGKELFIRFQYVPDEGKRKQDTINKDILDQLLDLAEAEVFGLKEKAPTEKDANRTLLEKYLTDFTTKHQFDYFIHKDLGKFLTQELDFYIKNEIMHLDDIEDADAPRVESFLGKVKAMRKVAGKIIQFLAQLEDFQKKLWLKKKFVLETHYCVTLDKIIASDLADDLLPEIAANNDQREEWINLFSIDDLDGYDEKLNVDFLKTNDKLLVDTKFFNVDFKYKLLSIFHDLDRETDGLLVHSDNFQGLSLISERYAGSIRCVHIDPPYNTSSSGFLYKNTYQHSSWLTMMDNRLKLARSFMDDKASIVCHIDENEYERLYHLFDQFQLPYTGTTVWDKRNPMRGGKGLAIQHEYIVWASMHEGQFEGKSENIKSILKAASEFIKEHNGVNEQSRSAFMKWVKGHKDLSGGERMYHLLEDDGRVYRLVAMTWPNPKPPPEKFFRPLIHPVTKKPCPVPSRGWSRSPEKMQELIALNQIVFGEDETTQPQRKIYLSEEATRPISSVIYNGRKGKGEIEDMALGFSYCHPVSLYEEITFGSLLKEEGYTLDFFAGSGTSGHAVINLNREDNGKRKYILIEMGEYFGDATKPRIQKAIYSDDWKAGKPVSRKGISQLVKTISLEQYEDALDNLGLTKDQTQAVLLGKSADFNEQYMLGYMLDVESKGSPSLLNIDAFDDPFSYSLRITRNDDTQIVNVDLIETFNYLLGLNVQTVDRDKNGIVTVTGKNSLDEKCLIIWRNVNDIDNNKLDDWFGKRYSAKDFEFDAIYINGDNNIENMKFEEQTWKVRLIEKEFRHLMFNVQDV